MLLFTALCSSTAAHGQVLRHQTAYETAVNAFNDGDDERAIHLLNDIIEKNPENTEALTMRAYIFLTLGEKQKALENYTAVLEIHPNNVDALTNRALIYMENESYKAALTDLDKRISQKPDDWSAHFDKGYCLGLEGEHQEAIESFTISIELNDSHSGSYANRGFSKINLLTKDGLIRPAREECKDACRDLLRAQTMGDTSVVEMIELYCE